jgi:superfamily II DNA or RNA helicase
VERNYFASSYPLIRLLKQVSGTEVGLRRGQLGAIFALSAHFTIKHDPAIVVMPTGAGKTASLMLCPFMEAATRVLVVTPSQLLRDQIAEDFSSLAILRRVGVVSESIQSPRVHQARHKLQARDDWDELREFDVVVTTPNTISPVLEGIFPAPSNAFDLLLVDEAHHSPATTWKAVLDAFPQAKRALFTATPFRRDRKHIKGSLVFNYPLSEARKDRIFGDISFVPVNPEATDDPDVTIARQVEEALREDRSKNLNHSILVRADSKARGEELLKKYRASTTLKLALIHSGHSATRVKESIAKLKVRELDGVICINMLGEGFDFPNLKIAALHSPHRSLGVTLQFIGRFARTGDKTIGAARFFAIPAEIEGETSRLFKEDAVWQDLVVNLAEARVAAEDDTRAQLATFSEAAIADEDLEEISLYAIRPAEHVKVYQVPSGVEIDIHQEVRLPKPFEVVFQQASDELSAVVLIANEQQKPAWSDQLKLGRTEYELFVVYYDYQAQLLFINASRRSDNIYRAIASAYAGGVPKILPLYKINRCLAGLTDIECFSVGMKNRLHNSRSESYRIVAGRRADQAIKRTDGRLYHRGHIFCRAQESGERVTLGYSSGSKIWSANKGTVASLVRWCRKLAKKIQNTTAVISAPGLDVLSVGEPLTTIPPNVLAVDWDEIVYLEQVSVRITERDRERNFSAADLSLTIDRANCTSERLRVLAEKDGMIWRLDFNPRRDGFFEFADNPGAAIDVVYGDNELPFTDFLNECPLHFYFADFARLRGEEWFPCRVPAEPFDRARIQAWNWLESGVLIEKEFWKGTDIPGAGQLSIHQFLEAHLLAQPNAVVLYDHRWER